MIFGGFTFASEMRLGRIAAFYGFSIPEAEKESSLGDFVRARLREHPLLGDHISFAGLKFVVLDMQGARITKVGLEPKSVEPVCLGEPEPA